MTNSPSFDQVFVDQIMEIVHRDEAPLSNADILQNLLQHEDIRALFKNNGVDLAQLKRGVAEEIRTNTQLYKSQEDASILEEDNFTLTTGLTRREAKNAAYLDRLFNDAAILATSQQRAVTPTDILKAMISVSRDYNGGVRILNMMGANLHHMVHPPEKTVIEELRQAIQTLRHDMHWLTHQTGIDREGPPLGLLEGGIYDEPTPRPQKNPQPSQGPHTQNEDKRRKDSPPGRGSKA